MKFKKGKCRILVLVLVLAMTKLSTNTVSSAKILYCDSYCQCRCNIQVKKTGVSLREGEMLSKKKVKKVLKVTRNGKKVKNFNINETGKVVKAKNGKYKLTISVGKRKVSTRVNVNPIKKIYIKQSKQLPLVEGTKFSISTFKKKTVVMADYKKGSDKKITTYKVTAAKTVKANSKGEFVITVKYGKHKDKISVPVVKTQTTAQMKFPTATPTVKPTAKPTEVPTATPTVEPTVEPTEVPTATPTVEPTEVPTAIPTVEPTAKPTEVPTATPTVEPTVKPTEAPTATPTVEPTEEPFVVLTVSRTGAGQVTVNNSSCDFTDDNFATEKVVKGTCKLVATNTSEYKFVRWIDSNSSELSINPTYEIDVNSDTTVTAVFEKVYTITVNRVGGKGKVTLDGESLDFYSNVASCYGKVAGRYNLIAVSTDDYNFVSWTDGNGKVLSTNSNYQVAISTSNVNVNVNFAEAEKTVNVTYSHENSQLIISEAVAFGETLTPPTKDIWKADKTFAGWKIGETVYAGEATAREFYDTEGNSLSEAIKNLTSQKKNVEVVSYYVDNPVKYYTVSVTGGTISSYDGEITDAGVKEGTHVYIKADVSEGKVFAGWTDAEGNIQSYEEEYDFYVTSDVTISANFSNEEVKKEPVLHFTGSKYELYPNDYGVRLYMASEIPEDYTKIEWGFLYTSKELSEEEMIVGSSAKSIVNNSSAGNADWIYDARFPSSAWEAGTTVKIRIYATVSSVEGSKTIYSEIISVKLTSE